MLKTSLVGFGLLLASGPALPAQAAGEQTGTEMMAQANAGQETVPGRDVLVAGAGAVFDGQSPAKIRIDIGTRSLPEQPKLELLLSPSEVAPTEHYLIVLEGGDGTKLGAVSFYPPKTGTAETFYFDAGPLIAEMKSRGSTRADLSLSLVPAQKTQKLISSKVRVLGARIAGN